MSKMSNIHLELTEQANELGFESIEEAEANGYHIGYTSKGWKLQLDMAKAQEKAHEAWLKEKESVLADLRLLLDEATPLGDQDTIKAMERAIDFVEGCHD